LDLQELLTELKLAEDGLRSGASSGERERAAVSESSVRLQLLAADSVVRGRTCKEQRVSDLLDLQRIIDNSAHSSSSSNSSSSSSRGIGAGVAAAAAAAAAVGGGVTGGDAGGDEDSVADEKHFIASQLVLSRLRSRYNNIGVL